MEREPAQQNADNRRWLDQPVALLRVVVERRDELRRLKPVLGHEEQTDLALKPHVSLEHPAEVHLVGGLVAEAHLAIGETVILLRFSLHPYRNTY